MSSSKNSSSSSASGGPAAVTALPERLEDVVCTVDVMLGTGSVSVRQCLALVRGSVIRLEQVAGADLQVRINGIPIADAEVVIMDDATSVRLTEILAPPSAVSS
jgi:flagellar motor switch protein FliN